MKQSYIEQADEYYREQRWRQRLLSARVPRGVVVRAGTLAALGGVSAIAQLLAACSQAGSSRTTVVGESAAGTFKYSRFPYIEKYNWRNLPWPSTPYIDGIMVNSGSGPSNWDFLRSTGLSSYGSVMDNLLNKRYGAGADMEQDELEGHIADKWSHAPDFSYFDYHIRPGVKFHDIQPVNGRLCTAEDVKYCLDVYKSDGLARSALEFLDRVEVLADKETVRVHVTRPVLTMDWTLAANDFFIFAREHLEGSRDHWRRQPIGTGPFKVINHEPGNKMETVRHEGFARTDSRWPGYQLPFLKEFKQFALAAQVTVKAALRSGQIDYSSVGDITELQDLLSTNPELVFQVIAPNTTYGPYAWVLNFKDPLFQDVRVRRALSLALNRRQMIDTLSGGLGSGSHAVGYTWLGRSDPFNPEDLGQWQQYDPAKARALLTEAGYPNGFEMECVTNGPPENADVMTQQFLEQIGVRVNFIQQESVVARQSLVDKTFKHAHARLSQTGSTGYDPTKILREWFLPESPKNFGSINDPAMADLIEKATYALDPAEQQRLLQQIHERDLDQAYRLDRYVAFANFVRQPWVQNGASAVQGYFTAYGYHQVTVVWIDDTAPEGRKGRLKA